MGMALLTQSKIVNKQLWRSSLCKRDRAGKNTIARPKQEVWVHSSIDHEESRLYLGNAKLEISRSSCFRCSGALSQAIGANPLGGMAPVGRRGDNAASLRVTRGRIVAQELVSLILCFFLFTLVPDI
jgi:hypothetical protein